MTPIRAAAEIAAREAERCKAIANEPGKKSRRRWQSCEMTARIIHREILKLEDGMSEEQYTKAAVQHATENGGLFKAQPTEPEVRFSEEARKSARTVFHKTYITPDGPYEAYERILAADATTQLRAAVKLAVEAEREACLMAVPGGTICDPQEWADRIRARSTDFSDMQPTLQEKWHEGYKAGQDDAKADNEAAVKAAYERGLAERKAPTETPAPKRKAVQIALAMDSKGFMHIVLCDDGTQFAWMPEKIWFELPPIPQPGDTL